MGSYNQEDYDFYVSDAREKEAVVEKIAMCYVRGKVCESCNGLNPDGTECNVKAKMIKRGVR